MITDAITTELDVATVARRARQAARLLAALPHEVRCAALRAAAQMLTERRAEIIAANQKDCAAAQRAVAEGRMSRSMFERLRTSERGIAQMTTQVLEVAQLPDPLDRTLAATELDDGLVLEKITCPLGVIGIVFESRPDVIPQVAALAIKSGNAVLLKGGTEATNTNEALVSIWSETLAQTQGFPPDVVNLLHTRDDVRRMLTLEREIDLIIPRGSRDFVRSVAEQSRIPVLGHGEGICHVYVDRSADLRKASDIAFDSKVQYPAACNSAETLLVHEHVASAFLPELIERLLDAGVELRGCARTLEVCNDLRVLPASDDDWSTEYSDLILAVKIVDHVNAAIEHINTYGSGHTEAIVTEDTAAAQQFMQEVDAAGVFHNASTRFADGFRYGLGAELGISTSKLHARGPVGLEGLTTYKYRLSGDGHTVASYSSGEKSFKHRPIPR